MTKEEAKDYIREWCPYDRQEEIIKALEQEPCDDCISRVYIEPIIEELENICVNGDEHILNLLADIKNAPSVTPQPKTDWIPVSERMPEEHEWIGTKRFGTTKSDEVYVTFETPKGDRFTKHLSFQNGKLSIADQQIFDVIYKGSVPIAWMPLPEPYKTGGER